MKAISSLNILFLSCLLMTSSLATTYTDGGECTDESILAQQITDSSTLGNWLFGWDVSIPSDEYCTHDAFYDFNVTYTLGTGDTSSNFMAYLLNMTYNSATKSCDPNATSANT